MHCINYRYPIEHAKSVAELENLVQKMLKQFDVEYFQVLHPGQSWSEFADILEHELENDPSISTLVYWLELAEKQKVLLTDK